MSHHALLEVKNRGMFIYYLKENKKYPRVKKFEFLHSEAALSLLKKETFTTPICKEMREELNEYVLDKLFSEITDKKEEKLFVALNNMVNFDLCFEKNVVIEVQKSIPESDDTGKDKL